MKVLYIQTSAQIGGAEAHTLSLIKNIPQYEWNICVLWGIEWDGGSLEALYKEAGANIYSSKTVSLSNPSIDIPYLTPPTVDFMAFPPGNPVKRYTHLASTPIEKIIDKSALATRPDIIMVSVHYPLAESLRPSANYAPVISVIHSATNIGPKQLDYSSKIVFVSNSAFDIMRVKHRALEAKSVVIHNGADEQEPVKQAYTDKLNLLYVGRISPEKNLNELVKLFTISQADSLTILGGGVGLESLAPIASMCPKPVNLEGWQVDKERYYQGCDAFILNSKSESCPLCVLEAMHRGIPVISRNVGDIKYILGDTGLICENGRDVISAINLLKHDIAKRRELGEATRSRARKLFSAKRMASQYRQIMESLC